ncbi:hypothetical protein [Methylophaga muralis]|uniref:PEP-CTERM protein-sorting domain-containing protein n=1 Tax=Methylophaga muralis TaxID=291169 RepID=A0A1E3GMV0_9GAMM|nr:hypothetical protein [Methylophaga muralis]ODN65388.1 hypothetical protein A9E74_02814 [Methylophaga muralis]
MKKAMLFFAALLFSIGANAASMNLVADSGKGVVAPGAGSGSALFGSSAPFASGAEINDVWSLDVTEAGQWSFSITANSGQGPSPSPFTASLAGNTFDILGSSILFSLFLDVGQYFLTVEGLSGHTFTGYDLAINAVPVPAALWLFAPALMGFFGLRRKAQLTAA